MMQPQQQTVVTSTGPVVQPMYISQPYQAATAASLVNSYRHRQSIAIGVSLIVVGLLSIVFNIIDLAFGTDEYYYYSCMVISYITLWNINKILVMPAFALQNILNV